MFIELTITGQLEGTKETQCPWFGGSCWGLQPEEKSYSEYLKLNQGDTSLVGRREASVGK